MRFMVIVKANQDSEAGKLPPPELFEKMGKFNEEMVNAGIMLAGEGLHPTSKGARIQFAGGKTVVTEGPFHLSNDLIAGFWIIKVKSKDEAIEWMKRAPFSDAQIELRQIQEAEDFGAHLPAEVRQQEERLRAEIEKQKAS
jgi:hypothetical protein